MQPSEYTGIAIWGQLFNRPAGLIEAEQQRAAKENAPADAMYRSSDGYWRTMHSIDHGHSALSVRRK